MTTYGKFTCDACGRTFTQARSDDEARQEFDRIFPQHKIAEAGLVCDPCFKKAMANFN